MTGCTCEGVDQRQNWWSSINPFIWSNLESVSIPWPWDKWGLVWDFTVCNTRILSLQSRQGALHRLLLVSRFSVARFAYYQQLWTCTDFPSCFPHVSIIQCGLWSLTWALNSTCSVVTETQLCLPEGDVCFWSLILKDCWQSEAAFFNFLIFESCWSSLEKKLKS